MANTEERGWWMDTSTVCPSLHSSFRVPITCGAPVGRLVLGRAGSRPQGSGWYTRSLQCCLPQQLSSAASQACYRLPTFSALKASSPLVGSSANTSMGLGRGRGQAEGGLTTAPMQLNS